MNDKQWEIVKACARCESMDEIPVGLIVDSPWIPGYCGISTIDFYTDMNVYLDAYAKIKADFPDVIFLPDYWVEFGMGAEPSGFGCKPNFYDYQPVNISHLITDADDIEKLLELPIPDPKRDGLLPLAINYYKNIKGRLHEKGEKIRMVASRGPLNVATHMMSVPEFLVAIKIYPDEVHKLLRKTTDFIKVWLAAQKDALDYVEGILMLDDIVGFLNEDDYKEFAHPYLKEIFDAFDVPVKMFHNDKQNPVSFPYIADLGVNIFQFSHLDDINEARKALGDKVCILGNVPPLQVLTNGTSEECEKAAAECIKKYGSNSGLFLSVGGGASPGMPGENLKAFCRGAKLQA